MFILRKITDSGVNVPETVKMKADKASTYKAGCALTLKSGVVKNCTATETAKYIAQENASGKEYISCFKVNPNMIFEAPASADISALNIGAKVTLGITNGVALGVTATTDGGVAEIVEKINNNTLYIKF